MFITYSSSSLSLFKTQDKGVLSYRSIDITNYVLLFGYKNSFLYFFHSNVSLMPFVNLPLFIGFSSSYSIDCKEESPIIMRNLSQMSSKS